MDVSVQENTTAESVEDLDEFFQGDDEYVSEEEEEKDHDSVVSKFGSVTTRKEPEELQVYLWETSRKVSSDFAPNDWKRLTIKSMVRKYTEHPSAVRFSAPQAEPASRNYSRTERICRIVISSDHPILLPNPDYILKLTHC